VLAVVSGAGGAVSAQEPAAARPNAEPARAVHLLSRATWGVRPADVEAALALGLTQWLERQLDPEAIRDDGVPARLAAFPTTAQPMSVLLRDFNPQPPVQRQMAQMQAQDSAGRAAAAREQMREQMTPEQRRERQQRSPQRLAQELVGAKLVRSVYSERQLEDVMADFWYNHFNVFFGKGQDRYFVGDYERTAIRPHVFGRFEDMLIATAQHPAMLFYLDNWQSVHVDGNALPAMAQQRARNRGLNENYARELLELHTLGVDGGYTQQDVIEVARAFTGWTFERPGQRQAQLQLRRPPSVRGAIRRGVFGGAARQDGTIYGAGDIPFVFRPQLHDRGEKVVLGKRLPANRGMEDGMDVIRLLSRHPATARHLATKLVERFVSDSPPADLVNHVADVFLKTDGDLRAVTRALFTADAFYRPEYRGTKVKTPYELVVSALRATHAEAGPSRRLLETLRTMGHLPYAEPAPTGFPAMSEDWVNTGALLNRMNFGLDLAAGRIDGVRIDGAALVQRGSGRAAPSASLPQLDALLAAVLPHADTAPLGARIREDVEAQPAAVPRQRLARALGLALGSPEFQRR
jgi:uncharacterized protein (DUF1800 family)